MSRVQWLQRTILYTTALVGVLTLAMGVVSPAYSSALFISGAGEFFFAVILLLASRAIHHRIISALLIGSMLLVNSLGRAQLPPELGVLSTTSFLLLIPMAGVLLDYRGGWITAVACIASVWMYTLRLMNSGAGTPDYLLLNTAVYTVLFVIAGLLVHISNYMLNGALEQTQMNERLLNQRNGDLQREVSERQNAEEQYRSLALSQRGVLDAAGELLQMQNLDQLWRRAVELAHNQLKVEQCRIYLLDESGHHLHGMYGINYAGHVTDEHFNIITIAETPWARKLIEGNQQHEPWNVIWERETTSMQNGKLKTVLENWVAHTALRSRNGRFIGVFFSDARITGAPFDAARQDLTALYCSLISNIAENKQLEAALKESNCELEARVAQRTEELEQARRMLEARVDERTRELAKLLQVSRTISSTLELRPLLSLILQQLNEVLRCEAASIVQVDDGNMLKVISFAGLLMNDDALHAMAYDPVLDIHLTDVIQKHVTVLICDTYGGDGYAIAHRRHLARSLGANVELSMSALFVPLMIGDRLVGILNLHSATRGFYSERHAAIAGAFASYAAVAIENAQLHAAAVRNAALAERSRLARELHDSVSQALYSIVLGAHTAIQYTHRDPSKVIDPLNYVLHLAEGALDEMRALIFELRPESLAQEGLLMAMRKQATALVARHRLELTADLGLSEPALTIDQKETLYRVALEAIQNALKHAQATRLTLRLRHCDQDVCIEVGDDGRGFDAKAIYEGHYGLQNMRERMSRAGGTLEVISETGAGTLIRARLPMHAATPLMLSTAISSRVAVS
jgi:signal transduction histidine kinase